MHVAAPVLGFEQLNRFCSGQPAAVCRVMLQDEIDERLTDDHAHLGRLTRIGACTAAGAVQGDNLRQALQHQIARYRIRQNVLHILQRDRDLHADQPFGDCGRHDLAMVGIGCALLLVRRHARYAVPERSADILARPARIDVAVKKRTVAQAFKATFSQQF